MVQVMAGRRLRTTTAILVSLLVLVGLAGWRWNARRAEATGPTTPSSVAVSPGHEADVATPDGAVRVHLPRGGVSGSGRLAIRRSTAPDGVQGWSIDLKGTSLVKRATMRFALPERAAAEPPPVVRWAPSPGTALATAPDTEVRGRAVYVRTDHFSFWTLVPWRKILQETRQWLQARLDDASHFTASGRAPHCEGETAVRSDGFTVTSDSGRRVLWCLGEADGKPVLKVVNARGYGVAVESTPGLRLTDSSTPDLIGSLADVIKPPPLDRADSLDLVPSGDTVTYSLDRRVVAGVKVDPDAGAYLLSALQYAVDTYTMVTGKLGARQAPAKLTTALKAEQCLRSMSGLATTDLTGPSSVTAFFDDALSASFDCVADAVDDVDLGPVLDGLVAPLVWLFTGLSQVAHGLVAVGDMVSDLDGYQIRLAPPVEPPTQQVVVDPFTARGQLRPGWSSDASGLDPAAPVDCFNESPNALGPGTQFCGSTADAANACWMSPESLPEIWCLDAFDPASRTLRVLSADGDLQTPAPSDPQPLFLELSDGSRFWYRVGGAWGGRSDGLTGAYGCANKAGVCADEDTVVLSGESFETVDRSRSAWRVRVGGLGEPDQRFPAPRVMAVRTAWFIAGHIFGTD